MTRKASLILLIAIFSLPSWAMAQAEIIEVACPNCGYVKRFIQGATPGDEERNVQHVIVVCERSRQIRNVAIPIDPDRPVRGEPLVAKQFGTGTSKLLGIELPKFLIPGTTCPLYPVTAYLDADVCPVDGSRGVHFAVVAQY